MATNASGIEISPFHPDIPEEDLEDLRHRIAATRRARSSRR